MHDVDDRAPPYVHARAAAGHGHGAAHSGSPVVRQNTPQVGSCMPSRRAAGSIQRYPPRLVEIISTPDDRSKPEFDSQNRWETGYSLAQTGL